MSIIETLITDRVQSDVDRVKELKRKALTGGGINALTADERAEYFNNPKGAYNYTDLNRVGNAVRYIHDLYASVGYTFTVNPKTNWAVSDVPTQAQMETYLDNVRTIKTVSGSTQDIPTTMDKLNYESANQIERLLVSANSRAEQLTRDFLYSGEFEAGEN